MKKTKVKKIATSTSISTSTSNGLNVQGKLRLVFVCQVDGVLLLRLKTPSLKVTLPIPPI
jgi:hypothetical protein